MSAHVFEWHITVRKWGYHYGKVTAVSTTPMIVRAAGKTEVTEKVRAAFEAEYDDFRKFWSHDWLVREVREAIPPCPVVRDVLSGDDDGLRS
jgi:hypothetical protein